jgi:hypothetical protein
MTVHGQFPHRPAPSVTFQLKHPRGVAKSHRNDRRM